MFVVLIGGMVAYTIAHFGSTVILNERLKQTVEGTKSDDLRKDIIITCVQIGLENPIIGVSPQGLSAEIGRRLSVRYRDNFIDAHNAFAHIIGGSGPICLLALVAVFITLWTWEPRWGGRYMSKTDSFRVTARCCACCYCYGPSARCFLAKSCTIRRSIRRSAWPSACAFWPNARAVSDPPPKLQAEA